MILKKAEISDQIISKVAEKSQEVGQPEVDSALVDACVAGVHIVEHQPPWFTLAPGGDDAGGGGDIVKHDDDVVDDDGVGSDDHGDDLDQPKESAPTENCIV